MQLLPSLSWVVLVASVVSSLIYFPFRYLETRSQTATKIISSVLFTFTVAWIIFLVASGNPSFDAVPFYPTFVFGLLGGFLHRKSSSHPTTFLLSFGTMFTVTLLGFLANAVVFSKTLTPLLISNLADNSYFGFSFIVLIMGQSITTPFLMWVWKSHRLQPGVDKHLDS